MSGNRFRPSGWAQLRESNAPAVADIVAMGSRAAVSALMTPAGERVLHRIGYGRVLKLAAAVVGVLAISLAVFFAVAMAAITATGPVSIAGKLLPDTGDLFGTGGDASGEQLSAAGRDGSISCHIRVKSTISPTAAAPASAPIVPTQMSDSQTAVPSGSSALAIEPIPIEDDGSISKDDAHTLVDPVLPGTSALQADVWFMYRAAGLGDWDTFTSAYRSADLRDDDQSADAPLQQVQRLNTRGVDMEPYRLIAAALTSAGQVTGRLKDPYPGFRDVVVTELVSGCVDDDSASAERAILPPPATASSVATEDQVTPESAEAVPESSAGE